ncbi:hypothetical protein ACFXTO_025449 [Malus domestica]|uniref:Uncharacterized protein n=1 Tax=Malus domestica TaxID=3750 RepID=A0A498HF90_MALDO|nr:hypothetical protein DVH24_031317 [Malus domestica]
MVVTLRPERERETERVLNRRSLGGPEAEADHWVWVDETRPDKKGIGSGLWVGLQQRTITALRFELESWCSRPHPETCRGRRGSTRRRRTRTSSVLEFEIVILDELGSWDSTEGLILSFLLKNG